MTGKPDDIPDDVWRRVLDQIREPDSAVFDAMADEQRAGQRRNGHGQHGFRDMWQAGVDALHHAILGQP